MLGGWEEGVIRILQSLIGVIRSIYHERTKILLPTPLPQVMNDDKPTFSYLLIYIYFSFILCIYSFLFLITFFHLERVPEGVILPGISGVSSNQPLPWIHLDEVRSPALS